MRFLRMALLVSISIMSWALTPPTPEINCCRTYINNGSLKKGCEKIVTDLSKCKDAVASWDKAARKWNKAMLKKNTKKQVTQKKILTSEECANQGGRVVNILSENCSSQENRRCKRTQMSLYML